MRRNEKHDEREMIIVEPEECLKAEIATYWGAAFLQAV